MQTELLDSYVHKTVELRRKSAELKFLTSQSLFSSSTIDVGTNLLLRLIIARANRKFENCLDLGCGYGALGMSVAASGVAGTVEMVDRDALAVDFSNLNVAKNNLVNAMAHSSLGLDDASRDSYDLIVSNLPGKAGSAVLRHLLATAADRLEADGEFWGVVVNPLWAEIQAVLEEFGVTSIHVEQGPRHTAFGFRKVGLTVHEDISDKVGEIYFRNKVDFTVGRRNYDIETSRGVEEFDALNYSTRLLLEQLYEIRKNRRSEAVVFNVSQGYVPVAMRASGMTETVRMVDRDLLALRTSERNLRLNQLNDPENSLHHQVGWLPGDAGKGEKFELIVGALRGDEPKRTLEICFESVIDGLTDDGLAVISGGSTPITRVQKFLQARKDVRVLDRSRYRGSSVLTLARNG